MTWYILVSTISFASLAIIWGREDVFNRIVKLVWSVITVWGLVEYGIVAGYIVRVH